MHGKPKSAAERISATERISGKNGARRRPRGLHTGTKLAGIHRWARLVQLVTPSVSSCGANQRTSLRCHRNRLQNRPAAAWPLGHLPPPPPPPPHLQATKARGKLIGIPEGAAAPPRKPQHRPGGEGVRTPHHQVPGMSVQYGGCRGKPLTVGNMSVLHQV
eukprot:SAG31_NODE_13999_length_832_cov_33.682128_1_plen_161_part_00